MKSLILFVLIVHGIPDCLCGPHFKHGRGKGGNLGAPAGVMSTDLPLAQWFQQKLDHFSSSNTLKWKQRYFVNDSFYDFNDPGPVFLMIGGEGPADPRWMVKGAWIDYAHRFKAFCFQLEHRYYGESHPVQDLSVKNLQYLSSSQALADLASFIEAMNDKYKFPADVKWVVFGGSYPGSLAAWMRLKYPHLVHAAVSSSGPLMAKVNFMDYFKVVVNALQEKTGDVDCADQLRQAHDQFVTLARSQPRSIHKLFRMCSPLPAASKLDMKTLYSNFADYFAEVVQYNEDNRISTNEEFKNLTINTLCHMMTDRHDLLSIVKFSEINILMLNKNNQSCLDYSYQNMIKELSNTAWGHDEARQWMYQTCTEFGFYQTSTAEDKIFGNDIDLEYFVQQCQDVFGTKYNETFIQAAADWTNTNYGGLDIDVSRVVFVHGSVDPWHALGIVSTQDNNAPAIYIRGTAHCANMYPASENDASELVEARVEIEQYLSDWLA